MAERFELSKCEIDMYQAVFLDFYVTQYFWASRLANFNNEQVSIYFTVVYSLLDNLKGRTRDGEYFRVSAGLTLYIGVTGKGMSLGENLIEFRTFLGELENGQLFSSEQISEIIEYINLTYVHACFGQLKP
jgi:hypothetical protein